MTSSSWFVAGPPRRSGRAGAKPFHGLNPRPRRRRQRWRVAFDRLFSCCRTTGLGCQPSSRRAPPPTTQPTFRPRPRPPHGSFSNDRAEVQTEASSSPARPRSFRTPSSFPREGGAGAGDGRPVARVKPRLGGRVSAAARSTGTPKDPRGSGDHRGTFKEVSPMLGPYPGTTDRPRTGPVFSYEESRAGTTRTVREN